MNTQTLVIRSAYDPSVRTSLKCNDKSRTKQSHKDECDINKILKKADKTGLITHVASSTARYGDFTAVNEYQESLNTVIQAQDMFDALPSDIRKRFANDPGAFFEFATNPANKDDLVKLGLAKSDYVAPVDPDPEVVDHAADPAPA